MRGVEHIEIRTARETTNGELSLELIVIFLASLRLGDSAVKSVTRIND